MSRSDTPPAWTVLAVHLAATLPLALVAGLAAGGWSLLVPLAHICGLALALRPPTVHPSLVALALAALPLLYWELPLLTDWLHHGRRYDALLLAAERAAFGGQPAAEWGRAWRAGWFGELMHAAYLSYYPLLLVPPLVLAIRGRWRDLSAMVFTEILVTAVLLTLFLALPVRGPRELFAPAGEPGVLERLTRSLLGEMSSDGTAFPSGHVAMAVAVTVECARRLRSLYVPVAVATACLIASTVYGGYHYALDALAGLLLGGVLAAFAPRICATTLRLRPRPGLPLSPRR